MQTTSHNADAGLFLVFIVTILVLFLIPMTIHRVFYWESDEAKAKKGMKKSLGLGGRLGAILTPYTVFLILAWIGTSLLMWYVSVTAAGQEVFDPFEILGVSEGASEAEIKRAYRSKSREYHPDRNPDPKAHEYFIEYISKAHKILTDEEARENWRKWGNPDGPQGFNIGIPLPPVMVFLLNDDGDLGTATLMALVALFILGPICGVIYYLWWSQKRTANNINHKTMGIFYYLLKDREFLALKFVPDIISKAVELQEISYKSEHNQALDKIRKSLKRLIEDKEIQSKEWRPNPSTNAKLILLAQMYRIEIPPELDQVVESVLSNTAKLANEFTMLIIAPTQQRRYGWLRPALSTIEFSQSLVQRVRPKILSGMEKSIQKPTRGLMQLAGVDEDTIKKLRNKKVRSIRNLQEMGENEARNVLQGSGISGEDLELAMEAVQYYPEVSAEIIIETEGEDTIVEHDSSILKMRILVKRPALPRDKYPTGRNLQKETKCICPRYPLNRTEGWWIFFSKPKDNQVYHGERLMISASDEWYEGKEAENDNDISVTSNGMVETGVVEDKRKAAISFDDDLEEMEEEENMEAEKEEKENGEKSENGHMVDSSEDDTKEPNDTKDGNEDIEIPDKADEVGTTLAPGGKHYKVRFQAPVAGIHTFNICIVSDCWVDAGFEKDVKIKVEKRSRLGMRGSGLDNDAKKAIDKADDAADVPDDDSDYDNEDDEEED